MRRYILLCVVGIAAALPLTAGLISMRKPSDPADLSPRGELIIFHAGSLTVPFARIVSAFNAEHPHVRVLREASGSRLCARKVSDLNRECDILASADYSVIESLLIPEHTEWVVKFAANEMAIAYRRDSHLSEHINESNWYEILARDDVVIARSDPNADPCGYRAVLTIRLAEKHYGVGGSGSPQKDLHSGRADPSFGTPAERPAVSVSPAKHRLGGRENLGNPGGDFAVRGPKRCFAHDSQQAGVPGGRLGAKLLAKDTRYIRPKETDLIALLECGEVDYIFLYRSLAEQHGLGYVRLPDEINLGNPKFNDLYATVSVEVSGKTPGSSITKRGEAMVYGVTIPMNAPNKAAALAFLEFLLDEQKGMSILRKCGQRSVVPAPTETFRSIPASLKRFAMEGK